MGKKKLNALGVYGFAGGFALGVAEHFRLLGQLENGPFGAETVRQNLGVPVWEEPNKWPLKELAGEVNFLFGNPPCAPWSAAGERKDRPDWKTDVRVECWRHAVDATFKLRPEVAAIESVRGIYVKGRELLDDIAKQAKRRGYQPIMFLENALDFGVPQPRPRFMLILTRVALDFTPTGCGDPPTVAEVLKAVKKLKLGKDYHLRPEIPPSIKRVLPALTPGLDGRRAHIKLFPDAQKDHRGKIPGRPGFLTRRLHPDRPAPVMTGGCHWLHPTEDRFVTVAENAALCGFPPTYRFYGGGSQGAYAQLGKGVLPPVAAHLAADVARSIHKGKELDSRKTLEVEVKRDEVIIKEL